MLRPFPLRQKRRPSKKVLCRQLCLVLSLSMHTLILLLRILKKHNPPSVRGPGTKKGYALAVSPQKGCRAKERKVTWFPYTNLSKCTLSPSFFVALSHTQLLIHSAITGSSLLFLTPGQTGSSRAILRSGGRQAYNCQTSPGFSIVFPITQLVCNQHQQPSWLRNRCVGRSQTTPTAAALTPKVSCPRDLQPMMTTWSLCLPTRSRRLDTLVPSRPRLRQHSLQQPSNR